MQIFISILYFSFFAYYLSIGADKKASEDDMKRQYRELDDDVKQKISQSSKGQHKTQSHKDHISQSMIRYWEGVPHKPDGDKPTTIEDLI